MSLPVISKRSTELGVPHGYAEEMDFAYVKGLQHGIVVVHVYFDTVQHVHRQIVVPGAVDGKNAKALVYYPVESIRRIDADTPAGGEQENRVGSMQKTLKQFILNILSKRGMIMIRHSRLFYIVILAFLLPFRFLPIVLDRKTAGTNAADNCNSSRFSGQGQVIFSNYAKKKKERYRDSPGGQ